MTDRDEIPPSARPPAPRRLPLGRRVRRPPCRRPWSVLGGITVPFVVGVPILIANAIWVIYRIAKGWMRFNDREEMYA